MEVIDYTTDLFLKKIKYLFSFLIPWVVSTRLLLYVYFHFRHICADILFHMFAIIIPVKNSVYILQFGNKICSLELKSFQSVWKLYRFSFDYLQVAKTRIILIA